MNMKLIIGLGNPGGKYKNNRHNVGKMLTGKIRETGSMGDMRALESDTFMNESGKFVKKVLAKKGLSLSAQGESLMIAHDDLDIPLGQYKIQFGVGPKVHNGVKSVEDELGTKEFWRIRIGIDARDKVTKEMLEAPSMTTHKARMTGEEYVLQDFTKVEREILNGVFTEIYKFLISKYPNS